MTEQEFGQIYSRSFDSTVQFLVSRGVYYDAAVDAAQDGWVRGWQYRDQLRDVDSLPVWVNSIALNLHRTFLRDRSKDAGSSELPPVLVGPSLDTAAIDARRVMRLIPPRVQHLLHGFYIEGRSIAELADSYGCSPLAVRIRLLRAKQLARSRVRGA